MPATQTRPWPRAIILVDMNAFFASIEQRDFPELRGRPVAVTNGAKGASIITASYEARAKGVKTGMHIRDARELCPDIVKRASRPEAVCGSLHRHHGRHGRNHP